jgi:hypothetical protein
LAPMAICDGTCVDLRTDPEHCGQCSESCDDPEHSGLCVAGDCEEGCSGLCDEDREICVEQVCVCREGFTVCGGSCVDLQTDPSHCGGCDEPCADQPCGDFECQPDGCPGFSAQCEDSCVDFDTDPLHCGECGSTCDPDKTCVLGECEDPGSDDD